MSDTDIRKQLNELDVGGLLDEQRKTGRLALSPEFREQWKDKHRYATALLSDERRGLLVKKMARLLYEITYSIATVSEGEKPTITNTRTLGFWIGFSLLSSQLGPN